MAMPAGSIPPVVVLAPFRTYLARLEIIRKDALIRKPFDPVARAAVLRDLEAA